MRYQFIAMHFGRSNNIFPTKNYFYSKLFIYQWLLDFFLKLPVTVLTKVSNWNITRVNHNYSIPFQNLFSNLSKPIRKTFWISFDANRLKINPIDSNSTRDPIPNDNEPRISTSASFRLKIRFRSIWN